MYRTVLIFVFCSFCLGISAQEPLPDNGRLLELYQAQNKKRLPPT